MIFILKKASYIFIDAVIKVHYCSTSIVVFIRKPDVDDVALLRINERRTSCVEGSKFGCAGHRSAGKEAAM